MGGFYLDPPGIPAYRKLDFLIEHNPDFREVDLFEATQLASEGSEGIVVVVENPGFEAAVYAYNHTEFTRFTIRSDVRPKRYIAGPREQIAQLAGYTVDKPFYP